MKRQPEMGEERTNIPKEDVKLTDELSFHTHQCEGCPENNHCSIEPMTRYFREHPEESTIISSALKQLQTDGYMDVVQADSVIVSPVNPLEHMIALAFGAGYVFAKGQPINKMTLSEKTLLAASEAAKLGRMLRSMEHMD